MAEHLGMGHPLRRLPSLSLIACLLLGCLEPPTLDDFEPPLADLGGALSWGPLDPVGESLDGGGPGPDMGSGPSDPNGGSSPPNPALAQLRLTEVLVDPEGRDGGAESPEFIELWNPGPDPVPLDDLSIFAASWPELSGTELGLSGLSLAAGGLLLVQRFASDVDPMLATRSLEGDVITVGFLHSGGLRNADGVVRIGPETDPIDELVYGITPDQDSAGWVGVALAASGSGHSMCRDTHRSDHDDASDWSSCTPNPGLLEDEKPGPQAPSAIPIGAVSIVEVLANPPGPAAEEKAYEFIELLNTSEVELELGDCRVGDDPSIDAPGVDPLEHLSGDGGCASSPTCLAPGRRALIVGQGYVGPVGDALVLATDDSTIADGGLTNTEPVVLWDAEGTAVSSYRLWDDPTAEPLPTDEQPLHRVEPSAPDQPSSWMSAPASPGEP